MLAFGIVVLGILLVSGSPLFMAFGLGGLIIVLLSTGLPIYNLAGIFFDGVNSWVLLAIPMFVFAGYLMTRSGMAKDLVDLLSSFTGRVTGGMAISVVVASAFLGALTGEALAVLAITGMMLFPSMTAANYERGYSAGIICASAAIGELIPPSCTLIIYGYLASVSVIKLFMAGILPGLLVAALLSAAAIIVAKKKRYPLGPRVTWKQRGRLFVKALPSVIMPVIVLGGIYGGIFTPTEAASVACIYVLIVGAFFYRGLNLKSIWDASKDTVKTVGMILILLCGVLLFSKALMLVGLPQALGNWAITQGMTAMTFLTLICVVFVVLGMAMGYFAMIALVPVIMPTVIQLGIDPIHLGIVWCVAALLGAMTPPAAGALYVSAKMFNVPVDELIRKIWPFIVATTIALFLLAIFPEISLWLPTVILG